MEMYRTTSYGCKIEPVDVERQTEKSVWIDGRRNDKNSGYHSYFESFEEAKAYIVEKAGKKVESAKFNLELAEAFLKNCESQTGPVKRK